ncbi:zinc finger BED domain-containing protein RICESLEEPER 2-like [Castanea sativa]|uniref:zinc finger BED domain-containing protein RICESLEEPER 2-like n=1 Tax=Castanea sativa TaxID=21020 RepID=UPI003F64F53D
MVDLAGEDLEVEEQEGEEGEQEPTNENSELDTSRKRKTTSDVWDHFARKKVDGKFKVQCHHCSKLYLGDSSQGATHLCSHLARCPRLKFKDIRDMRQQVLIKQQNKMDGTMSLNAYQFDQGKVMNNLARMVILHEYPISIVDHIGFREFVVSLQPLFKLVTINTLKNDILKIYDNEREKALKMTENNGKWNIDRKLSTITVDNCSTNDAMIRLLLNKLNTSSLMLGGSMLHMRCAAHILNLIVQDRLSLIGDGIEMIRDSMIYWTGSPKMRQKFKENACQLRVQCTKELS